jgi:hypothetical protein
MDIIWTLLLTVCLNDTCASQTIAWFEEKPQCIAMKLFTDAITGTAAVAKIWLQGLTGRYAGTGRAARTLQKAVGATEDGSIGPLTLMKVKEHEVANVINRIAIYREEFYRSLDTFDTFGRGWLRRNDETRKQALAMG